MNWKNHFTTTTFLIMFISILSILLVSILNLYSKSYTLSIISGYLILFLLPGVPLTAFFLKDTNFDSISSFLLGIYLSLSLNSLLYLILCYLIKDVSSIIILISTSFISIALLLFRPYFHFLKSTTTKYNKYHIYGLIILLLAVAFRFVYLHYTEYIGDEAGICLYNAIELIKGNTDVISNPLLANHTRPPMQVLLPAIVYLFTHSFDEVVVRFPFAVSGLISVWFIYIIACEIFGSRIYGWIAGSLAALNGYFVAFSRIVQYQSFVITSLVLTFLFLYKFINSVELKDINKHFILSMFIFSIAVLSHFESLIFIPVVLFAIIAKLQRTNSKKIVYILVGGICLFCIIAALYYLSFSMVSLSKKTSITSWEKRFDMSLHFNIKSFWATNVAYNYSLYMILITILSLFSVFNKLSYNNCLLGIWFLSYFIFYVVLCKRPSTHLYTIFPAWILLASYGVKTIFSNYANSKWVTPVKTQIGKAIFWVTFTIVCVFTGNAVYSRFIQYSPISISRRNFPPGCHILGTTHGSNGWKTVGYLFRTGLLYGSYASNESRKITSFYLRKREALSPRRQKRITGNEKYLIEAIEPLRRKYFHNIPRNYHLIARVYSNNKLTIKIFEKNAKNDKIKHYYNKDYKAFYNELDKKL